MKSAFLRSKHALSMPCLLLAALLAAGISPEAVRAKEGTNEVGRKKIGWVETVKLEIEGWTVHADTQLVSGAHKEEGEKALKMLANHLQRIAILMPEKQLAEMRKLEIRIDHSHPELHAMQYHPSEQWLTAQGYDPALAKKVHVTQAAALLSRGQMLKHPAVILHELAHAYHDQVLGFDEPEILKAYEGAMKSGIYEKVLLFNGETVRHYATTNHKEYFAEATEAYFYRNDFQPFVRAELQKHDPAGHAVMERVWGKL